MRSIVNDDCDIKALLSIARQTDPGQPTIWDFLISLKEPTKQPKTATREESETPTSFRLKT